MSRTSLNQLDAFLPSANQGAPPTWKIFNDPERLADVVRRVYTLERRLYELRTTGRPSEYCPVDCRKARSDNLEVAPKKSPWPKIAAFLIEKRIGPIDYIARQFDQHALLVRPPLPNELCGSLGWERYTASKNAKSNALAVQLRFCRSHLATAIAIDSPRVGPELQTRQSQAVDRCVAALYAQNQYPAIFIYCAAADLAAKCPGCRGEARGLMREYELQSAIDYVRFRANYDEAWGRMIPPGFGQTAQRLYQQVLAGLP